MFFFEKKNQKTFVLWMTPGETCAPDGAKVFWFFFSKKNDFLATPAPSPAA
jgi:hypothetical protein